MQLLEAGWRKLGTFWWGDGNTMSIAITPLREGQWRIHLGFVAKRD